MSTILRLVGFFARVVVQGITGREGRARAKLMRDYGTRVVAGCTPGRAGEQVDGVPVYDTVAEAAAAHGGLDASVIFVPAPHVKAAALEAIAAGVPLVVLVGDRVPVWDVMEVARAAAARGVDFLGPNTLGCLSVGKGVLGMIGGRAASAREWFKSGRVGGASRSGGMTSVRPATTCRAPGSGSPAWFTSAATRSSACRCPTWCAGSRTTARPTASRCSAR